MHAALTRSLRWFGLLEPARRLETQLRMREARELPGAVILGAQKCGTTSLHGYLVQHSGVIAPLRKEVHYFDVNYGRGERWYRAHFGRAGEPGLNLDSSPYYLFHPLVPQRLQALLPHAKLIVLLRDPVRRAYSHYWHERDRGREPLSFEDAIAAEPDRIGQAAEQLARGDIEASDAHRSFSYVARGRYAEQLERWYARFPREQVCVLRFESLAQEPLVVLNRTLAFLGLPALERVQLEKRNVGKYPPMASATRERLQAVFEPENRRLEQLLGEPMGW